MFPFAPHKVGFQERSEININVIWILIWNEYLVLFFVFYFFNKTFYVVLRAFLFGLLTLQFQDFPKKIWSLGWCKIKFYIMHLINYS
jgi:hypothetical protein